MDKPMDNECFDMAIRIVAFDPIIQMVETDVHYMDLRFCVSYYNLVFYCYHYVSKMFFARLRWPIPHEVPSGAESQISLSQSCSTVGLGQNTKSLHANW